jgi:hypothetical protein
VVQNRNKLIELFIGNLSNAIVHEILSKAIDDDNIRKHYDRELKNSFDISKKYREKINPNYTVLPDKDIENIKNKLNRKVNAELQLRISKGYENIDLDLIENIINKKLKDMKID